MERKDIKRVGMMMRMMMVLITMLVLALAQVKASNPIVPPRMLREESNPPPYKLLSTPNFPSSASQLSDSQPADCTQICAQRCKPLEIFPPKFTLCYEACMLLCSQPPLPSAIFDCTLDCAESMSTDSRSDAEKVQDYIHTCSNTCKKEN
ncbi:uncharacterized protein LOC121261608 [Juglans microcarpa x Juglans regia]|uniref:uncharacterized protein LOC121261608 n=1 Tax=Juglans microcarpa x Juglans regia TaxID=2249226 RepID=UPI001B7D9246|nr:uncharacterized protein LOC121261608 [Juglans microcarpa x Juglans regia]